jgi:hypothetical protein
MSQTVPGSSTSKFDVVATVVVSDVAASVIDACRPVPSPRMSTVLLPAERTPRLLDERRDRRAALLLNESRSTSTVTLNGTSARTRLRLICAVGRTCGWFHVEFSCT